MEETTKSDWSLLLAALKRCSFEQRPVTLASGKQSDFYIDCKRAVLSAEGHQLVASVMLDALKMLPDCDAVAGVELGGFPLASAVSLASVKSDRPLKAFYVRKGQKDHGTKRMIEGDYGVLPGTRVVVLEDVVTTGASTLAAISKLRDAGHAVVGAVALVDRLDGGTEAIVKAGVPFVSITTRDDFLPNDARMNGGST